MTIHIPEHMAHRFGMDVPPELRDMRIRQDELVQRAKAAINSITDDAPKARALELEREYDAAMAEFDRIEERAKRIEGVAVREAVFNQDRDPRTPTYSDVSHPPREVIERGFALRPDQRMVDHGGNAGKRASVSVGDFLRAMAVGPKNDAERRALSEGTPGAGGYTVPDILGATLIDAVRANSVAFQAGALTVPLKSDVTSFAKVLTDPAPSWRLEEGPAGTGDPTFGPVSFTARSLAVLVKVSEELLQDSLNIASELPILLAKALASELDRVALYGTGTPPEPKGVENFTGINSVASGGLTSWSKFVDSKTEIRAANHNGKIVHVLHPRDWGTVAKLTAGTDGQPLQMPAWLQEDRFLTTTKATSDFDASPIGNSTVLSGDFSKLMIGMRQEIRVEILKERYRENLQIGFLAHLRADVVASHENAFCKFSVTH